MYGRIERQSDKKMDFHGRIFINSGAAELRVRRIRTGNRTVKTLYTAHTCYFQTVVSG